MLAISAKVLESIFIWLYTILYVILMLTSWKNIRIQFFMKTQTFKIVVWKDFVLFSSMMMAGGWFIVLLEYNK